MSQLTRERAELWRKAGECWLGNMQLRPPVFLESEDQAAAHEASGVLACISALTFTTLLNMHELRERGVESYLYTFMVHEIGHHAIAPAGFTNQMRYLAAVSRVCGGAQGAAYVNLALDLLINDLLYQRDKLPVDAIYRRLSQDVDPQGAFRVMLGAMELLWGCEPLYNPRSATKMSDPGKYMDALVAIYTLYGEGRRGSDLVAFVTLAARIFHDAQLEDCGHTEEAEGGWDVLRVGEGGEAEQEALRRWLRSGGLLAIDEARRQAEGALAREGRPNPSHARDGYTPGLLRDLGIGSGTGEGVSATDVVVAYYEAMANGHLFDFLSEQGGHSEGYPESLRLWAWGEPMEEIDWVQTAIREGNPLPGINTVAWEYGFEPEPIGTQPFPVDLDLYIDTSGSMPDPHQSMSHIALGAFIFALSVMRQGGAVRVTIWSQDMHNLRSTSGYSLVREQVLAMICYSIRGGTQFPVEHWERTIQEHRGRHNKVHTVILSDDGISTWFQGRYETARAERMLERVQQELGAGGTVILNGQAESMRHELPPDWLVRGCRTWEEVVQVCADVASKRFA